MSARLGQALTEYLRRHLTPGQPNFVLIEGISSAVAEGVSQSWDDSLPTLAIVSPEPHLFGSHALTDGSATQLRNEPGTAGVVLVLCDGEQVPDRQSLNLFQPVSPRVLLESAEGMGILSQQSPPVGLDGPARAVREAIVQASPASRPSALSVAAYLDVLAGGADPLRSLPIIGGFTDHVSDSQRVDSGRVSDNLALAARRTSEDLLKPTSFADLRRRAERVLAQRPGLRDRAEVVQAADEVMARLEAGSSDLLSLLHFDEAREILEQRSEALSSIVRREIRQFRASLLPHSQAAMLPWNLYEQRADELSRGPLQRPAAQELCDLDDAQQRQVFTKPTRNKLERLLRDKAVNGSNPSCPEAAIVRAAQQLGGLIERVQVLEPKPPTPNTRAATNRTGAGRILTLACARLRLGGLMQAWHQAGGDVDGLLLRAADDEDLGDVLAAFVDAGLAAGAVLPLLQLRLHADDGSTVQVDWRPDLDDAAMLRSALVLAEAPALTVAVTGEPTLRAFCGAAETATVQRVAEPLVPLARSLQATAREVLDRGLTPTALQRWTDTWTSCAGEREAADDTENAEALALTGAVLGDHSVALTGFAPLKSEWLAQYLQALWQLVNQAEEPKTDADPGDAVSTATAIARTTAAHHPAHLRLRTRDDVLLPTSEGRLWSVYGGHTTRDESGFAGDTLRSVVIQLLTLQPEAAGHLRCLAWGPGAADLLTGEAVRLLGTRTGRGVIGKIEVFCIGSRQEDKPSAETLAAVDEALRGERDALQLRYLEDLAQAREILRPAHDSPAVHLALITGLTEGEHRLQFETPEVEPPAHDGEVLFAPRVWQRPRQDRRTLLMPPAASPSGHAWLRLQNAVYEAWPETGQPIRVPEVRTGTLDIRPQLIEIHELALWIATLDRYATRDSLEHALGRENVAILHQERAWVATARCR